MKPLLNPKETGLSLKPELSLEQDIRAHLGEFDLIALLRLLKFEGFKEQDIWFSSHNSIASQKRVIESVKLHGECAFIQLNLGLLAPTGILPSHIRQFMDRADIDDQALQTFFQFFDHLLIVSYLGQLYPEINQGFFTHWDHTKKCYVQLQNMRSHCSLHWLFECAFPEFNITLKHTPHPYQNDNKQQILGYGQLGGSEKFSPSHTARGFNVYLTQLPESQHIESNKQLIDWQQQIKNRLSKWIFPWLNALMISLDIYLCVYRHPAHLKLHHQSTLGYDPLYNPGDIFKYREKDAALHYIPLYSGLVQRDPTYPQAIASGVSSSCSAQEIVWGESCRLQL